MKTEYKNTTSALDVDAIRSQFPILRRQINGNPLVYLDNGASAQKPQTVIDTIDNYYREANANIHRGVHHLSQQATTAYEDAREIIRAYINAEHAHEVIFTSGTTQSINLIASSWGRKYLNPGDEVIISTMEHHSNIVPWQLICEERQAKLKIIPITRSGELCMDVYAEMLSDRTRLVATLHVSNALGTINPVDKIIELAHARGVPVLLDGAQAVPHMHIDVQALDVDFYAFSGHKIFGPTGVGVLYAKESLLNEIPPYQGGGEMIERVTFAKTTFNVLPYKFEAGTPNIAGGIGLGSAISWFDQFNEAEVAAHEQDILAYTSDGLGTIEGMNIIGNAAQKASVISFLVNGTHPFDIGTILDQLGIAVRTGHHCTQPLMDFYNTPGTVRASFAIYNNRADVDALVAGVERAVSMLTG